MANGFSKLVIVNSLTARENLQYVGDVVDVIEDDRWLSPAMLENFDYVRVKGEPADVRVRLAQFQPRVEDAFKWNSDGEFHWTKPTAPDTLLEMVDVFFVSPNKWYRMETRYKFIVNTDELTAEEKQLLESIDITNPSVDSYIRKTIKDITLLPGNNVEIIELRNTEP